MTVVDRPDNGQGEGPWRVGSHYGIHVYQGDRPVGTFLRPEDAARAVTAVNGRAGAGEQQREQVADVIADHQPERLRPDGPIHHCSCGWGVLGEFWSLHVADELLALLGGPQPDGEVRQHRMDADCWCQPVQHPSGAWDHQ